MDIQMDTNIAQSGFWKTRFLQALLVAAAAVIMLPSCWSFFFLAYGGWLKTLGFSLSIAFFRPYQIYPPSFVTACFLAIIIALRSMSWGSVSLRYTLIAAFVVSLLIDLLLRVTTHFWPEEMAKLGLANEAVVYWVAAWVSASLVFWVILNLSGLTRRYKISERPRLYDAAKLALVYAIFGPILYAIITLWVMVGDSLVFLAARGLVSGEINTSGLMLISLAAFCGVRKLRLDGGLAWCWLLLVNFTIALCFWIVDSIFVNKVDWQQTGLQLLAVYSLTAIALTAIGGGLLRLMGVAFNGNRFRSTIYPSVQYHHGQPSMFALFVLALFVIVAPPVWQCGTLMWRGLLFSLPPASFFTANLSSAYLNAGLVFSGSVALIAYYKKAIDFNSIILASLFSACCSLFLPMSYLGVDFGIFYNFIGWSMLLLAPAAVLAWYILSCCKQVRVTH